MRSAERKGISEKKDSRVIMADLMNEPTKSNVFKKDISLE